MKLKDNLVKVKITVYLQRSGNYDREKQCQNIVLQPNNKNVSLD